MSNDTTYTLYPRRADDADGIPGNAAAYPYPMDLATARELGDLPAMGTNDALAAAEEVLYEAWVEAAERARKMAGRKGVNALRKQVKWLCWRYHIVHRRRVSRISVDLKVPMGGDVELTPAAYRMLAKLWWDASNNGRAKSFDEAGMRHAVTVASAEVCAV